MLLINRGAEQSAQRVEDLRSRYKSISIEYMVVNLDNREEIASLEEQFQRWEDLDIGIVVNNAGSVASGPYLG